MKYSKLLVEWQRKMIWGEYASYPKEFRGKFESYCRLVFKLNKRL